MNKISLKLKILILIFIASNTFCYAQLVQNKSFDVMLATLLSHNVKEVGAKDVNKDSTVVFFDSREKNEYNVSHLKNSIWIGYDDFDMSRVKQIPKTQKIIVYCSVGYRSEKITEKLNKAGYKNVSNLVGGIFEWKNQNNIVVDNAGMETQKVHAFSKNWGIWLYKGEKVYN
jgi:rhodanese-related sulfurtransferase